MPIKDYEYYHGAVLTKILRKDIPTSLKLVETNVKGIVVYIQNKRCSYVIYQIQFTD